ncbi:MAG: hypothetical protein ACYC5S_01110 [Thiobacillus sp.]
MSTLSLQEETLIKEASQFANGTYTGSGGSGVWKVFRAYNDQASGYQATVYINHDTKRIYFANTGTNERLDIASWPDAYTGAGSDQYDYMLTEAQKLNQLVQPDGDLAGYTIYTTGHSWGELMGQIQTYVFGWTGVGFDGPGAAQVVNDPRFGDLLTQKNIIPIGGNNFISINTEGLWVFGGGIVGSTGIDIEGTRKGYVSLESSTASGITHLLLTVVTANPGLGYIIGDLLTGVAQHDMSGIDEAIQAGSFTLDDDGGDIQRELQNFVVDDGKGNRISFKTDNAGNIVFDQNGNPLYELTLVGENGEKYTLDFDYQGKSLNEPSGFETLVNGIATYGPTLLDSLSLIKAIQSGEPLPIVASGLRLANGLTGGTNLNLSGAANATSGILSLLSLDAALEQGDTLAAVTAGAQAIAFGAQAFSDFAAAQAFGAIEAGGMNLAAETAALQGQALANTMGKALPVLSLIGAIRSGDAAGIAVSTLGVMNSFGAFAAGGVFASTALATAVPVIGWAYAVYSIIDSLFGGDEIPDPWGNGQFVWNGTGISYNTAGETGGNEAVANVMSSVLSTLNALIERERQQNPGSQLGIIPNRMPTVGYDMSGYRYTDIDPLTGAEKHPALRFDTSGNPYNAEAGSPESFQSIIEGMVYSALSRQAIAPLWEVLTARAQTDAGDPKAGLTEEERAGRDGKLAAPVTGATQTFRPVVLDMDGDGIETVNKAASGVAFDVDDSGFMKETGWATGGDAFLTLDRDYNGQTNSGREMFSNSVVDISRRGLAGMAWVDANYDGRLSAADPVWNELKVWRDDGDGVDEAGENSLADLGISELNYSMSTFTQSGEKRQLASPDLEADRDGIRVSIVPEGILVQESSEGRLSLLVTRIDDKTAVEANRDGVKAANEPMDYCERIAA